MASNRSLEQCVNEISNILKQKSKQKKEFYYENEIAASEIEVEVRNVGKLNFPLNNEVIHMLKNISAEAKFGLNDQTILDKNVRDTCEIKPDKFTVKFNSEYFEKVLSEISRGLGLVNVKLEAHLYNLLIYGPGQFFKRHQDTEKLKGMIGTLIILLPSPHIGGDLIIQHLNQSYTFRSENLNSTTVKYIAFYCDCDHEIMKVKDGYRVALVYNLVLTSKQTINIIGIDLDKLKKVISEYFSLCHDVVPKLAYFLDHEYTESSLKWHSLKSTDQRNAIALRNVAQELNLIPHLALVEVHQTTEADPDFVRYVSSDSELIISHTAKFEFLIDQTDQQLPYSAFNIPREFTCMTKKTEKCKPYRKSKKYTGNEGVHKNCWYRRAAVVLWEKSKSILMSFTYNYDNVFKNLLCSMDLPEKEEEVLEIIEKADNKLYRITANQKQDFKTFVRFALRVDNSDIAFKLLCHFNWKLLEDDIAEELSKLQEKYGPDFITKLLPQWHIEHTLSNIFSLVKRLITHGIDLAFVQKLLEQECTQILKKDYGVYYSFYNCRSSPTADEISKHLNEVKQILRANSLALSETIYSTVFEHIISQPDLYPLEDLLNMLFSIKEGKITFLNYKPLQEHLISKINETLATYSGPKNNWSILNELPCNCEDCVLIKHFLHSKTEVKKVISPILVPLRKHLLQQFEIKKLPVHVYIDKNCKPHKFIIEKEAAVFTDSGKVFDKLNYFLREIKKL